MTAMFFVVAVVVCFALLFWKKERKVAAIVVRVAIPLMTGSSGKLFNAWVLPNLTGQPKINDTIQE